MKNTYKILINSYDPSITKSLSFLPIPSNSGDTDSVEILKPFCDDFSDKIPEENPLKYYIKKPHFPSKNPKISIEPNFLSDRIEENIVFFPRKNDKNPSKNPIFANKSFSFAKNFIEEIAENPEEIIKKNGENQHVYDKLFKLSRVLKEKKQWGIDKNEEKMLENCSFKPKINKKSSFIAMTRSFKDLFPKKINEKPLEKTDFSEEKPKKIPLKFLQKSCERLFTRKSHEKSFEKNPFFLKKISKKTEEKAAEKFKREFDTIVNTMMLKNGDISKEFSLNQVLQILSNLGFVTPNPTGKSHLEEKIIEEMWILLTFKEKNSNFSKGKIFSMEKNSSFSKEKISKTRLFEFLLCVLGINPHKIKGILSESKENEVLKTPAMQLSKDDEKFDFFEKSFEKLDFLQERPQMSLINEELEGKYEENPEKAEKYPLDFEKIMKKYDILYCNRLTSQNEKTFKILVKNPEFTPNILRNSKEMAIKAREKLRKSAHFTGNCLMELYQAKKQAKINSLFLQKMEKIEENCLFRPEKISRKNLKFKPKSGVLLNKLSSPKTRFSEKNTEEIEFEKYRKECTFKPNILVSKASNSSKSRKPLKNTKENKENYDKNQKKEVLLIDVKLKEGKLEKILVYKDSDVKALVSDFVVKHRKFPLFFN